MGKLFDGNFPIRIADNAFGFSSKLGKPTPESPAKLNSCLVVAE